ncbi:MAG: excisionase family DNA-binding protein [Acidobacteriales bacterium]|nr:excisionase family DNA-binding protein [Terriglobales bacterium]
MAQSIDRTLFTVLRILRLFQISATVMAGVDMVRDAITIQPQDAAELHGVSKLLRRGSPTLVGAQGERAILPIPLYNLLRDIVRSLEKGQSLVVMPEEQQLTTQRAAELLGMSRPYLIQLLDAGEMPYHLVGKHRRIALRDVLTYAKRRAENRRAALDRMARDAFEAGLYDNATIPEGGSDE